MSHTRILLIAMAIALFSGCASTFLPPERLASKAQVLLAFRLVRSAFPM